MNASNVTISPELLSGSLDKKRKTQLRRQHIIELIESKPTGAQIKLSEFGAVTDMKPNSAHHFLKQMAKAGLISIEKLSPHELTYHVLSGKPKVEWKTITPHEHNTDTVKLAMRFFWETQSDSLHEFVEWVGKQ